ALRFLSRLNGAGSDGGVHVANVCHMAIVAVGIAAYMAQPLTAHADASNVKPLIRAALVVRVGPCLLTRLSILDKIAGADQTRQAGGLLHELATIEKSHD